MKKLMHVFQNTKVFQDFLMRAVDSVMGEYGKNDDEALSIIKRIEACKKIWILQKKCRNIFIGIGGISLIAMAYGFAMENTVCALGGIFLSAVVAKGIKDSIEYMHDMEEEIYSCTCEFLGESVEKGIKSSYGMKVDKIIEWLRQQGLVG